MPTLVVDDVSLHIPECVTSLEAFVRWNEEPDFPEKLKTWWLNGKVWADISRQQYYSHLAVKNELYRVLAQLVRDEDLGDFVPDGLLIAHEEADVSGNPDGTFISHEAFEEGRAKLVEGSRHGYTLLEGSPDMVLEVVSDSSVEKDYEWLREAYFDVGVKEYWLVDARKSPLTFTILRRNSKRFLATRGQDGWLKSQVFGKSFRLLELKDRRGNPKYRLETK